MWRGHGLSPAILNIPWKGLIKNPGSPWRAVSEVGATMHLKPKMRLWSCTLGACFPLIFATMGLWPSKEGLHNNLKCSARGTLGHPLPFPDNEGAWKQTFWAGDFQGMQACPLLAWYKGPLPFAGGETDFCLRCSPPCLAPTCWGDLPNPLKF